MHRRTAAAAGCATPGTRGTSGAPLAATPPAAAARLSTAAAQQGVRCGTTRHGSPAHGRPHGGILMHCVQGAYGHMMHRPGGCHRGWLTHAPPPQHRTPPPHPTSGGAGCWEIRWGGTPNYWRCTALRWATTRPVGRPTAGLHRLASTADNSAAAVLSTHGAHQHLHTHGSPQPLHDNANDHQQLGKLTIAPRQRGYWVLGGVFGFGLGTAKALAPAGGV